MANKTIAELTSDISTIHDEPVPRNNTKERVAGALQDIVDSYQISALLPDGSTAAASRLVAAKGSAVIAGELSNGPVALPNPGTTSLMSGALMSLLGKDLVASSPGEQLLATDSIWGSPTYAHNTGLTSTTGVTGYPDPWGGKTAVRFAEDTSTGLHRCLFFIPTNANNGAVEFEFYVKADGCTELNIHGLLANSSVEDVSSIQCDLSAGTATQGGYQANVLSLFGGSGFRFQKCEGGWFKAWCNFVPTQTNNYALHVNFTNGGGTSYAGNASRALLFAGQIARRRRQVRTAIGGWSQATASRQPLIKPFLGNVVTPALSFERSSAGCYLTNTTATAAAWGNGGSYTLFHIGRLCSETVPGTGDGAVVRVENAATTSYTEFGYRSSSGTPVMYLRNVLSGGNDISAVSTVRASHVPTVRAVSVNSSANTAQFYADGVVDGTAQAFDPQTMTCDKCMAGNYDGDWAHQLSDVLVFSGALTGARVLAISEELMALHGYGLEPWQIIAVMGQSNSMRRIGGSSLPQVVPAPTSVSVPGMYAYETVALPGEVGNVQIRTVSLWEVSKPYDTDPLILAAETDAYGVEYMVARYCAERGKKVVSCQYGCGGIGWDQWQTTMPMFAPWVTICQRLALQIGVPSAFSHVISLLGEGNCGPGVTDTSVRDNVTNTIEGIRASLSSPNMRAVIYLLSDNQTALDPYRSIVNAGFVLYAATDLLCDLMNTNSAPTVSDKTHYSEYGMIEIGHRGAIVVYPHLS